MIRRFVHLQRCLVVVVLALAMMPFAASAQGNSGAAHACQGEGYIWLAGSGGETFRNAGQCASYAANGGTFAEGAIVVPAGYSVTFSDGFLQACNELSSGYTLTNGASGGLGSKAEGCAYVPVAPVTVGPFAESAVLVVYLTDGNCGVTYGSDGFHGRVTSSATQFFVDIADAGPGCSIIDQAWGGGSEGNLSLTVTVHP